ncbi:hypothetical protein ACFLUS_05505 [Chloroflexota bacterium]
MQEIEQKVLNDLPSLPTGPIYTYAITWHPYVKGYVPPPSAYVTATHRMEVVWLDK